MVENHEKVLEAPTGGLDRQFLRKIMDMAVKKSNIKDLSIADAQAIIWFPEKRLFRKLGIQTSKAKVTDYEQEARQLFDNQRRGRSLSRDVSRQDRRDGRKDDGQKRFKEADPKKIQETFQVKPSKVWVNKSKLDV